MVYPLKVLYDEPSSKYIDPGISSLGVLFKFNSTIDFETPPTKGTMFAFAFQTIP